jgi:hypothetical protein
MKKKLLIITLLITVLTFSGFAFEKGTKSIGGNVGFSSSRYVSGDDFVKTLSISPMLGYFVMDNLLLEVSPSFRLSWKEGFDTGVGYGLGIGGRYFVKKFYAGFMFDYNTSGTKGHMGNSKNISLLAGYLMPIVKNIFLNMGLNYRLGIGNGKTSSGHSYNNDTKILSARAGINIFFK